MSNSIYIITIMCLLIFSCNENQNAQPFPIIDSEQIYSGRAGETLIVRGSGFNTSLSENKVIINDVIVEVTEASDSLLEIKIPENISNGSIFLRYDESNDIYIGEFTFIKFLENIELATLVVNSINELIGKFMDSTKLKPNYPNPYSYSQGGIVTGVASIDGSLIYQEDGRAEIERSLDGNLTCTLVNFSDADSTTLAGEAQVLIRYTSKAQLIGDFPNGEYVTTQHIKYSRFYSEFKMPITIVTKDKTINDLIRITLHRTQDILRETDVTECRITSANLVSEFYWYFEN